MDTGRERDGLIALLMGALAIALSPIFVRLSETGPIAAAFWRVGLALPLLWLWLQAERRRQPDITRPTPAEWRLLALAGFCFAGDLGFWHWSIRLTTVANATLLANLAPLFVTLASWAFWGQRFRPAFLAGMGIAILGAGVLMSRSLSFGADHLLGDSLGIVTAIFYAGYMLTIARLRTRLSTVTTMTWSALVTALLLLPIAIAAGDRLLPTSPAGWTIIAALAVVSHFGGQSLIAFALAHLPATFSSVGLLLQPAAAAILAWMLLDEQLGWLQAIGGAVVLAGIALARHGSRATAPADRVSRF